MSPPGKYCTTSMTVSTAPSTTARRPACRRRRPPCRRRGSRPNDPRNCVGIEAVSAQDNDTAVAALGQADADVAAAQAAVDTGAVNLAYAHIVAPISGRIGKSAVTQGALVTAGQAAPLATIQQLDPIYVEVNQSSSEWLALKQDIDAGRVETDRAAAPAKILLENGDPYPHEGKLQFSDVTVDPSTGNFLLRAIVPNPNLLLLPGMYVRAMLNEGLLTQALLAPQVGITRDPKGNGSAMVVNHGGKVEARSVRVSRTIGDQWLVEEGLSRRRSADRRRPAKSAARHGCAGGGAIPERAPPRTIAEPGAESHVALLHRPPDLRMGHRAHHHAGRRPRDHAPADLPLSEHRTDDGIDQRILPGRRRQRRSRIR